MPRLLVLALVAVAIHSGGGSTIATAGDELVAGRASAPVRDPSPGATTGREEVPPPEDCVVAPRPLEDFAVPTGTPQSRTADESVSEVTLPGTPADGATVAVIEEVAWEYTACLNAGDYRRIAALTTDASFREWLLMDGAAEADDTIAQLLARPMPLPPDRRAPLDVRGVRALPDGRVGAIVDWCREANFFIFEQVEDRWLYDDEVGVVVTHGCLSASLATPAP